MWVSQTRRYSKENWSGAEDPREKDVFMGTQELPVIRNERDWLGSLAYAVGYLSLIRG